jgi:hypothetical protein
MVEGVAALEMEALQDGLLGRFAAELGRLRAGGVH